MRIVVLDSYALCAGELCFARLEKMGDLRVYERTPQELAVERIGDAQIVLTNKVLITREVMEACKEIRYIGVTATGYNVVDVRAAAQRGIVVTNVPAYSTQAVAQHVLALLLHSLSHVANYDACVKQGKWISSRDFCFYDAPMEELSGKTMGIVGFGSIGQSVARIALAMDVHVLVHTPHPKPEWEERGVRFVSLDELLAESDILTLHCPLTEQTRGMLGKAAIAQMKKGVRVINTARGPLVDEEAMAHALQEGRVACYMADVLSTEPPAADNPLLQAPHTVITPHVAWAPRQTRERLLAIAEENVHAFLEGKPVHVVRA
ncbi:MAG TPA: D-2-hydroxyacid dehydrogenase [Candidatus Ventricola intestinavium]|nr:D-2-hydroxyacid dehydrogenase [Candidatus Ventricola intestinavium]